ncbi:hypothetical protein Ciccas_013632, partial [Cichlidogyrus casuarinus]
TEDLMSHLKQVHPAEANELELEPKIVVDSNDDSKSKDCASSVHSDVTPEPINLIMPSSSKKSATVGIWKFFKFSHHSNSSQCQLLNGTNNEPCTFEVPGRKQSEVLEHLKSEHPDQYMKLNMDSVEAIPRASSNAPVANKVRPEPVERCKMEMAVFPDQVDSLLDEPDLSYREPSFKVLPTPEVNQLKLVISRTNRHSVSSLNEPRKRALEDSHEVIDLKKEKLEPPEDQSEPATPDCSVKAHQPVLCKFFMISVDFNNVTCCLLNTKTESICGLQILDASVVDALQHLKDEHEEHYKQVLDKNPELEKLMSPPAPNHDENILRYFNLNDTQDLATCQIGLCRIVLKFAKAEELLLHLKLFHPMEYFLAISSNDSTVNCHAETEQSPSQEMKTVALAQFMLKSGLSIKLTEQKFFQEFLHAMDPNFRSPDILKLHEIQGKLLKVSELESQSLNGLAVANSH